MWGMCIQSIGQDVQWRILFKNFFIYLFLERGRKGERVGQKHQCVFALTGDLAHNSGMCPDWESNMRPFDSLAGAQSTEPHQSGQWWILLRSPVDVGSGHHVGISWEPTRGYSHWLQQWVPARCSVGLGVTSHILVGVIAECPRSNRIQLLHKPRYQGKA